MTYYEAYRIQILAYLGSNNLQNKCDKTPEIVLISNQNIDTNIRQTHLFRISKISMIVRLRMNNTIFKFGEIC